MPSASDLIVILQRFVLRPLLTAVDLARAYPIAYHFHNVLVWYLERDDAAIVGVIYPVLPMVRIVSHMVLPRKAIAVCFFACFYWASVALKVLRGFIKFSKTKF